MMKRNILVMGAIGAIIITVLLLAFAMPLEHSNAVEGTREFVMPSYMVGLANKAADEQVVSFMRTPQDERRYEDMRVGDNGELIIVATPQQVLDALYDYNAWIVELEKWALDEERGYRLAFNEDRTEFTYWTDQYAPIITSNGYSILALCFAMDYQLFSGIPPEECMVSYTIYDVEKDEVFFQSTFPPDAYCLYPPDLATGIPTMSLTSITLFDEESGEMFVQPTFPPDAEAAGPRAPSSWTGSSPLEGNGD